MSLHQHCSAHDVVTPLLPPPQLKWAHPVTYPRLVPGVLLAFRFLALQYLRVLGVCWGCVGGAFLAIFLCLRAVERVIAQYVCCIICDATKRWQEVEELRQKLQEVELGTALSQADSNFLQRELEEKEADIGERRSGGGA